MMPSLRYVTVTVTVTVTVIGFGSALLPLGPLRVEVAAKQGSLGIRLRRLNAAALIASLSSS
jgi:hypothetical protein